MRPCIKLREVGVQVEFFVGVGGVGVGGARLVFSPGEKNEAWPPQPQPLHVPGPWMSQLLPRTSEPPAPPPPRTLTCTGPLLPYTLSVPWGGSQHSGTSTHLAECGIHQSPRVSGQCHPGVSALAPCPGEGAPCPVLEQVPQCCPGTGAP